MPIVPTRAIALPFSSEKVTYVHNILHGNLALVLGVQVAKYPAETQAVAMFVEDQRVVAFSSWS